ncbi:MAG: NYN domain-containing protein [Pseudomonadota bacterium]
MLQEPKVKRAVAFVDGQNLFRHAKDAFGHYHPNYDPKKLFEVVCTQKGWKATQTRLYTGIPHPDYGKRWSDYWRRRISALKRDDVRVITRHLRYRTREARREDGTSTGVIFAQEKGIDVRLALDFVLMALRDEYNVGVIFSQDQDLAEAAREVKTIARDTGRWIKIASAFPSGSGATSSRGVDVTDWIEIDENTYNACLDPRDYRPNY